MLPPLCLTRRALLVTLAMPALARAEGPTGPSRLDIPEPGAATGAVNGTVTIGGCEVAPGDLLIGDADGLVALPPALLEALIDKAEAKIALEERWTARLAAGEDPAAIFGSPS